jgi:hypothetical protein
LNKNIWKSFKSNHTHSNGKIIRKTLNKDQNDENDLIKKLSERLIADNFHRNPTFNYILKTSNGYTITRFCIIKHKVDCTWNIYINIDKNEAILTCNKECEHKNPIKHTGLF